MHPLLPVLALATLVTLAEEHQPKPRTRKFWLTELWRRQRYPLTCKLIQYEQTQTGSRKLRKNEAEYYAGLARVQKLQWRMHLKVKSGYLVRQTLLQFKPTGYLAWSRAHP